ncbi:MAG: hypothetical protein QF394_08335 [Rhodospirillales bacterium]|nr:hypothetical protein [Rhodospirillales bacterium]
MSDISETQINLPQKGDSPSANYSREPSYDGLLAEKDVAVPMRDGVNLSIDFYRPDTEEKLPALLAFAIYNKDIQGPDVADYVPPELKLWEQKSYLMKIAAHTKPNCDLGINY